MTNSRTRAAASALVRAAALIVAVLPAPLAAQQDTTRARRDSARRLSPVVTTATRTPTSILDAPAPVLRVDSSVVRERLPNSAADLLRELPGVDVTGVGTNQTRPVIRGQRGQRILLLEDGLRLNNSRRQQDFGELPALVDVNELASIEIVRGPSSVLYGTDAIGGVINLITRQSPGPSATGLRGTASFGHGSADAQNRGAVSLSQRLGGLGFRLSGAYRKSTDYTAPSGTFGSLTLNERERVFDSGVRDGSVGGMLTYDLAPRQQLSLKAESYQARNAGFGYLRPEAFGANQPKIAIRYPDQDVRRFVAGYRASLSNRLLADRVELTTFLADNRRHLTIDVNVPFGPPAPPGSGVTSYLGNFTDMRTIGVRAEATKILGERYSLTYGADAFRDRSNNTDSSSTTVTGFGPPSTRTSNTAQVPNAAFRSAGVFGQLTMQLLDPITVIVGTRGQDVLAETKATPGLTAPLVENRNRTVVATASTVYRLAEGVRLVGSVGRGFRAPNLVEQFFEGTAPEGSGHQKANPDLRPETSLNVDLGARVQRGWFSGEAFVFRNDIRDGIRAEPTGETVNRQPVFRNVNVDRLRFTGAEGLATVDLTGWLSTTATYSTIRSRDVVTPSNPVGDSYSTKVTGELTVRDLGRRGLLSYVVRHNGERKDGAVGNGPVGPVIPGFTVHGLRADWRLIDRGARRQNITLSVDNLANTLYAETANASFFRPQPGRTVMLALTTAF
jgi:hemoglobin/transferrin/lactoferrin receptor protein